MLPFPCDRPLRPQVFVDQNTHVGVPRVDWLGLEHMAREIVIETINQVTLQSGKNALRCFCYNLLSDNSWVNPHFDEMISYVVKHIRCTVSKERSASPESVFRSCVEQILTLYSSEILFKFPELVNQVPSSLADGCSQNVGVFNNLKTELAHFQASSQPHMHPNQPHYSYPAPVVHGHHGGPSGYPPGYMASPTHYPPGYMPGMPSGPGYPPHGGYMHQPGPHPFRGAFDPSGQPGTTRSWSGGAPNDQASSVGGSTRDFSPSQGDHFSKAGTYLVEEPIDVTPTELVDETSAHPPIYAEAMPATEQMDRSKHFLSILGETTEVDQHDEIVAFENAESKNRVVTDLTLGAGTSVVDAISQTVADTLLTMDADRLHRRRYMEVTPVMTDEGSKKVIYGIIGRANRLEHLALHMRAATVSFGADTSAREAACMAAALEGFNRYLTDRVNRLLSEELLEIGATISSFVEDYPNLPPYVLSKLGAYGSETLDNFAASFLQRLKHTASNAADYDVVDVPDGLDVALLPTLYALVGLPFTRETLGLPLTDETTHSVRSSEAPRLWGALYDIHFKIDVDAEDPIETAGFDHTVVVTTDGYVYRVWPHARDSDTFVLLRLQF